MADQEFSISWNKFLIAYPICISSQYIGEVHEWCQFTETNIVHRSCEDGCILITCNSDKNFGRCFLSDNLSSGGYDFQL